MGTKDTHKRFIDELKRFHEASKEGDLSFVINTEGLSDEEAEIAQMLNKISRNYEAALEYDLMKYKLTSDALGIALWDMDFVSDNPGDPNNKLIWSQEARQLMGFSDEKDFPNVLSSLTDRIHPDEREKSLQAFADHIMGKTGDKPFDIEYRIMMRSGEYRHFRSFGTTHRDSEGNPLRVAGAIEDIEDKKQLQESLRKAQEERVALANLVNILNGLSAMICVTDPETDELLFINNSMKKAFGIDYDWTGQKCYKVIRGFDERCDFCPCNKLSPESIDNNQVLAWEHYGRTPEETYRYISRYIKWPGGKIAHIQNSVDITDIKQFQAELENQNLRLNLLIGGLKVGLWDRFVDPSLAYDDDKAQIWWSDEFRKLLGYTDESDFPNEVGAWLGSVHPDDLQMTIDAMMSFLNDKTGKTEYDVENRMKTKTGEYRWFRSFGSAIRDADGNPVRTAGATEDITARKRAERELADRGEFIQTLFDNAPVGVTLFDKDFKYIDCNEHILKMFGGITRLFYSTYFGSREHSPEYQPDGQKSYEKALSIIRRAVVGGENIKFDWVHRMPDGRPFPVEITMTRIKQGNEYIGLAYVYDMREQTRLKEDLEEALHKAEDANRAKSDFLAKMSHEIRTPMNAILGLTEIQMRSGTLPSDTEEALGQIYDSGNLLMGIINDILDLSKIEADKLEIIPVTYDIMSLVNDTAQLNRMRSSSDLIEFDIDLDKDTPHNLIGDELRIKQILNNVLSNAFKYTDKGRIEFTIHCKPIHGSNDEDDVMLIFTVSDTGQGMSPEQLDLLFTDYTRFNLETNRTTSGTGLGLSITKRLTDLMNGTVDVESEVGKGTTFTVSIPQKRHGTQVCGAELANKLHDVRFRSSSFAKKTQFVREYMPYGSVLVVDDVDSNIYVTKGMLLPYGLQIDVATSGFEVIEKLVSGKVYDIIFMDHMMPVMDGIETTAKIREMGYKGTIVALTANALIGQADVFLQNGFDAFVSKPIDSRELNYVLNELIRNKKPPEVVEAARQEQAARQGKTVKRAKRKKAGKAGADSSKDEAKLSELRKLVVRDAKRAVETLERAFGNICPADAAQADSSETDIEKEIDAYTITVHGMKSALSNIGEADMSAVSLRLELAGKERDMSIIKDETPDYIASLRSLINEYDTPKISKAGKKAGKKAASDIDTEHLKKELAGISKACEEFDVTAARKILSSLISMTWPKDISDVLDEIHIHLLHSDFDEAAKTAAGFKVKE